jgi:glycyl-tRNA synthetase beta chain
MSGTAPLLVELFTEELPPKALHRLGIAFAEGLLQGLREKGLAGDASLAEVFATPRRLAARIGAVVERAADKAESKKLMPVKVAYAADGSPTPALQKRLEKESASLEQLKRKDEAGTEYVFLDQTLQGVSLAEGLQAALTDTIAKLPVPKLMSYQLADGETTVHFVRPAHGLIALHGDKVVDVSALGLKSGRVAHGHRFQGVQNIEIENASIYDDALYTHGRVVASFELRRSETERQLRKRAGEIGASLGPEAEVATLLDEVTALVEHPTVYVGEFEPVYLRVPSECLILTMRANQKYFPLFDAEGKLTNQFLIVSNMRLTDPSHVIEGNQRVVRPRLADARFFFETDKKTKLIDLVPKLASVTYQQKLGSQLDRVERVRAVACKIARNAEGDAEMTDRAAFLAKADLLTHMVGEFPELQGVMGKYYALHDGEPEIVAQAIESHYLPRFAGDALPASGVATCVALADKLDALVGIFGIGLAPTGDKDPFGLRRAALGVVRILCERGIALSLNELTSAAHDSYPRGILAISHAHGEIQVPNHVEVSWFIKERARGYLREMGYTVLEIEAVLDLDPPPAEYVRRLEAVRSFLKLPEAAGLAEADKRMRNILNKSGGASIVQSADPKLFAEDAERQLLTHTKSLRVEVDSLVNTGKFGEALTLTAQIHLPVSGFFDQVMVNVEDRQIRENRFALLLEVVNLTNRVANISKLAT